MRQHVAACWRLLLLLGPLPQAHVVITSLGAHRSILPGRWLLARGCLLHRACTRGGSMLLRRGQPAEHDCSASCGVRLICDCLGCAACHPALCQCRCSAVPQEHRGCLACQQLVPWKGRQLATAGAGLCRKPRRPARRLQLLGGPCAGC